MKQHNLGFALSTLTRRPHHATHANPVPRQYLGSSPSLSGRLLGQTERQTAVIPIAVHHTGASWRSSACSSPHARFQGPGWLLRCRISTPAPNGGPSKQCWLSWCSWHWPGQQRGWLGTKAVSYPGQPSSGREHDSPSYCHCTQCLSICRV